MARPRIGDTVEFYEGLGNTPQHGVVVQLLSAQFTAETPNGFRMCLYSSPWKTIEPMNTGEDQ